MTKLQEKELKNDLSDTTFVPINAEKVLSLLKSNKDFTNVFISELKKEEMYISFKVRKDGFSGYYTILQVNQEQYCLRIYSVKMCLLAWFPNLAGIDLTNIFKYKVGM